MKCFKSAGLIVLSFTTATSWVHCRAGAKQRILCPLEGWSWTVEDSNTEIGVLKLDEVTNTNRPGSYDLSSPREWLEYQESVCFGPGAYTVIRCDYRKEEGQREGNWVINGKDFHFNRLWRSLSLLEFSSLNIIRDKSVDSACIVERTDNILNSLLKETETKLSKAKDDLQVRSFDVMVTLLWHFNSANEAVSVKGHAFTNGKTTTSHDIRPFKVTLAIANEDQSSLPNRQDKDPKAKISSWCRERKSLEQKFKSNEIDEVLLVQATDNDFHILEGLVSNVFVVYKGGILRTAENGVLEGYARDLVIKQADECGLEVDHQPISLDDSNLWEEVFLTSSVKMIVPVECISVPNYQHDGSLQGYDKIWSSDGARRIFKSLRNKLCNE
mmetsp:Transcript_1449/g.1946  ORF Transcript_1449/g.1946 Transcript_1449/m.1946 type:complete len:385 (+) Transcript_1449:98-1252(+)